MVFIRKVYGNYPQIYGILIILMWEGKYKQKFRKFQFIRKIYIYIYLIIKVHEWEIIYK